MVEPDKKSLNIFALPVNLSYFDLSSIATPPATPTVLIVPVVFATASKILAEISAFFFELVVVPVRPRSFLTFCQ